MSHRCLAFVGLCSLAPQLLSGQAKVPLTPQICTQVQYLAPEEVTDRPALALSPSGKRIAFVVQRPNLSSDEYEDALYVADLDHTTAALSSPVIVNSLVADIQWFPDNHHLAILMRFHGRIVLAKVDSSTSRYDIINERGGDITDYSMDSSGNTIGITVRLPTTSMSSGPTRSEIREGYRLTLGSVAPPYRAMRRIYVLRRSNSGRWHTSAPLSFVSPLSSKRLTTFIDYHFLRVNMSPNGQYLLIDNMEKWSELSLEGAWKRSPVVEYLSHRIDGVKVSYLYDLNTHTVSMPLQSPQVGEVVWAPDSKGYVQVAQAPVGSSWEAADLVKALPTNHSFHLFSVDLLTGTTRQVVERTRKPALAWTKSGDLIVEDDRGAIHVLRLKSNNWTETECFRLPLSIQSPYTPIVGNGQRFVMEYENASIAPEILIFDRSSNRVETVERLNPQVDNFLLPKIRMINWTTTTGYAATGLLLLPPDYDARRRYPLVIENGSILYQGEFVCDAGADHVSSFTRGLLADSGIIYLIRYWPGDADWKNNYYPPGYPGEIGEAEFQVDLVKSAIRYLDHERIIDPTKVGIVGFSRGGWYTEYALAHSDIPFAAATVTDNALYSLGEYWYLHDDASAHSLEGMFGGPPYGATFKNWFDYSITFNMDKIHTPLMIEIMGYGNVGQDPNRPLNNLAKHYEEFVGLKRRGKPVELYFYPLEQHQVNHPVARIAAAQRNLDWFRFWLQGYERPDPADAEQYERWRHFREDQPGDVGLSGTTVTK